MSHERATRLEHQLGEANETIRTLRGDLHAERATNKVLTADVERLERELAQRPKVRPPTVPSGMLLVDEILFQTICKQLTSSSTAPSARRKESACTTT